MLSLLQNRCYWDELVRNNHTLFWEFSNKHSLLQTQ